VLRFEKEALKAFGILSFGVGLLWRKAVCTENDINVLGSAQKDGKKMIENIWNLSYQERSN